MLLKKMQALTPFYLYPQWLRLLDVKELEKTIIISSSISTIWGIVLVLLAFLSFAIGFKPEAKLRSFLIDTILVVLWEVWKERKRNIFLRREAPKTFVLRSSLVFSLSFTVQKFVALINNESRWTSDLLAPVYYYYNYFS